MNAKDKDSTDVVSVYKTADHTVMHIGIALIEVDWAAALVAVRMVPGLFELAAKVDSVVVVELVVGFEWVDSLGSAECYCFRIDCLVAEQCSHS